MKTDDLIAKLSAHPAAKSLDDRRILGQSVAAVAVPVVLFLTLAGVRHGLGAALSNPVVLAKSILPALAFVLALAELPHLARPEGPSETRLFRLAVPALAALALFGAMLFNREALESCAEPGWFGVAECVGLISLLSIVPTAAGIWMLRDAAATKPGLTGAVVGLVAGTGAAAGYSLFCTRDNPLFYLFWYGVAIGLATLAGHVAGKRWLVW